MTCKVSETIARHAMLQGAASVCVGVSGGVDSVCLLHLLLQLRPQFGYRLQVVHVNHGLRGEAADADARFVQSLCESWGVPCTVVNADVAALAREKAISEEAAGRLARYAAFEQTGCERIAVAHTRSDRIETSLFHLARGTSLKGAAGIPPVRGKVIRPLIDCARGEIEAYAQAHSLPFITDETNETDRYTRNALRHRVLSPLREIMPAFEANWARFLDTAAIQHDYIRTQAASALAQAKTANGFDAASLANQHEAVLTECVLLLLSQWMQKPPEERHLALCVQAIRADKGRVALSPERFFSVKNGVAALETKCEKAAAAYCVSPQNGVFQTPCGVYRLRAALPDDPTPVFQRLDAEKLLGELTLRTRLPGDRFAIAHQQGSKTLKKLFNEAKLPLPERSVCAVLCCGDKIAWVEGFGADRAFAADKNTKTMLIVQKEALS